MTGNEFVGMLLRIFGVRHAKLVQSTAEIGKLCFYRPSLASSLAMFWGWSGTSVVLAMRIGISQLYERGR